MEMIRYMDVFAGAGGWSVGLESRGWHHLAMYDINASACRTARKNFGPIVFEVDLRGHRDVQFPAVDIVVGSPPCQGFSNEGRKQKNDIRNNLLWDFLDLIERVQPKVWVLENVPGLKRLHKGELYDQLLRRLRFMDYCSVDFLLDASEFGVPQTRERFFVVGSKMGPFKRPEGTHSDNGSLFGQHRKFTLWDAISDLPRAEIGNRIGEFDYDTPPGNHYQRMMRQGSPRVFNHTTQRHSERVLAKIRKIPSGGDMSKLVGLFAENQVHYCGGYRRAVKDKPSWTAYWTRGMTSIHPDQDRFLSPRECARIQSFPDRFIFHGTTIENYTQVCNAVPPLLAEAMGRSIEAHLGYAENAVALALPPAKPSKTALVS